MQPGTAAEQLDGLRLHLAAMSAAERKDVWTRDLGPLAHRMDGYLDRIAEYFHFDEPAIRLSAAAVRETAAASEGIDPGELGWRICREYARRSLETLAQRVDARACWADLVLPAPQVETLRQIAIHVRQRAVVNDQWGFAAKHARGLGLTALFAGSSGTGKTMAAEILAAELDLDLYKVDLASVVSKYIGETEKNLRAIFDGAEQSGAILLFDEADALFGKRSEVRDSHDRYANLEISYLLQQMEVLPRRRHSHHEHAARPRSRVHAPHPLHRAVPVSRCGRAREHLAAHLPRRDAGSRTRLRPACAAERRGRCHPQHRHARRVPRRRRLHARRNQAHPRGGAHRVRKDRQAAHRGGNARPGVNHDAAVPRTVHFDIGRITLHGYSPGQRTRFVTSLRGTPGRPGHKRRLRLARRASGGSGTWTPARCARARRRKKPPTASPARLLDGGRAASGERHE